MNWGPEDFLVAGLMLSALAGAFWLVRRGSTGLAWLFGWAIALGAAFVTLWVSLAVGIIGAEGDPANLVYLAVFGVAVAGAVMGKFRPQGMRRAMLAAATAQTGACVLAGSLTFGQVSPAAFYAVMGFNALLLGAFLLASWMFHLETRSDRTI